MKLICNSCGKKITGDEDKIGVKCTACSTGAYIQDLTDGYGEKEEVPSKSEQMKMKESKIQELIDLIKEDNMYEFTKKFKILFSECVKEKIEKEKKKLAKKYSDNEEEEDEMDEQNEYGDNEEIDDEEEKMKGKKKTTNESSLSIGMKGKVDDKSWEITKINKDEVHVNLGGAYTKMSTNDFFKNIMKK